MYGYAFPGFLSVKDSRDFFRSLNFFRINQRVKESLQGVFWKLFPINKSSNTLFVVWENKILPKT